jgi:hypothetical protein
MQSRQFPAYCRYEGFIERSLELGDRPRIEPRDLTGRREQENGSRFGQHT